jgi:hypothetical protein
MFDWEKAMKSLGFVLVGLGMICFGFSASAEQRFALLIGNQTYGSKVGALNNPHNDIELIGKSLKQIGFTVVAHRDLTRRQMMRQITEFVERLGGAGPDAVGFVYYSGHGVSNPRNRINYLIPTDVVDMQDDNIWFDAISLEAVLKELEQGSPNASHIVVFDACRNELRLPFRSSTKGFEIEGQRTGLFIAFSTSPNTVALDRDPGGTGNGPYAKVLASELIRGGQDHLNLFANVKEQVETVTGTQRPWNLDGLPRRLYLAGRLKPDQPSASVDGAKQLWDEVGSKSQDMQFLATFATVWGNTEYGVMARRRMLELAPPDGVATGIKNSDRNRFINSGTNAVKTFEVYGDRDAHTDFTLDGWDRFRSIRE